MLITIIGSGNSGLAMAAHLALYGHEVRLWNRTPETLGELPSTRTIHATGAIEGDAKLALVTADMAEALAGSKMIFITTPATAHAYLAQKMAQFLEEGADVVLCPGRTFGAIEYLSILKMTRPDISINIAETQSIIYTCRKQESDGVVILAIKSDVLFSTFRPEENIDFIKRLPEVVQPFLIPAISMVETSIGNVGMILHCLPLLLNTARTEGQADYKYYTEGISPSIARMLEKLDFERTNVAYHLGYHLESCEEWLKRTYRIQCETLYECIQHNPAYQTIKAPDTMVHRYIYEDIPYGLVPLEAAAKVLGVDTPLVSLVIDLAIEVLDHDFRGEGRTLGFLNVTDDPVDELAILFGKGETFR